MLDAVTTRTLEIHDGEVDSYDGGYGRYLLAKAEREALADRTERNRQNFLRREVEWLRRSPKARSTKQKARIARAEAAQGEQAPKLERQADLRLSAERQGKTILEISELVVEREGRRLIDGLTLALRPGERIGVVGPNGSGKTSLLLALQGALPIASGRVVVGANTKIGYLDQARADLDPEATVREAAVGDATEVELGDERLTVGSYLERFLFRRPQQRLRVGELSGGERARVCLARLLAQRCNLLLLDEPTNDLDVSTLSALESMLLDFGGSVILVSHDRWMLDRVSTSILVFEGGGRVELEAGNYSDHRLRVAARTARGGRELRDAGALPDRAAAGVETVPAKRDEKPKRTAKLNQAERRELDGLFERIEAIESHARALQEKLADPATYQALGDGVAALREELEATEAEALRLTTRWEELEARSAG